MTISVIIPTHNRSVWLDELLGSLEQQSFPAGDFEVIVVDDGSTDDTEAVAGRKRTFRLRYVFQQNQGDAAARNHGARESAAELLVFLDDDMIAGPGFLEAMAAGHQNRSGLLLVGSARLWLSDSNPLQQGEPPQNGIEGSDGPVPLPFAEVCSNNLSVRRTDYFKIGPMESLDFPGSSMWCDVEFAYRARKLGFDFLRSPEAVCWHRDYVFRSLESLSKRMRETAYRAVILFQRHPDLIAYLPMFRDMTPVDLRRDPPALILRKLLRRISASQPLFAFLQAIAERIPEGAARAALGRWVVGGHIYQGYRQGLHDFSV